MQARAARQCGQPVHWLGWGLALAQLLLFLLLLALWFTPQGQLRNSRWQPPEAVSTDVAALLPAAARADTEPASDPAAAAARVQRMLERPLFALSRRPPPPAEAEPETEPEPVQDQWAQAQVLGTFSGGPSGAGAIVVYEGKAQRLLQGQSLGGWVLQRVREREVELERAGSTRTVALTRAGEQGTLPAPAATLGGIAVQPAFNPANMANRGNIPNVPNARRNTMPQPAIGGGGMRLRQQ